jgi:hypothetical protein
MRSEPPVADKVIRVRTCDIPKCPTPEDDVKRIESTLEGEGTVIMDLCATHRAPLMEVRRHAHKKVARRRGIKVTDPKDIRK